MESLLAYLPDIQAIASLGYWVVFLAVMGESIAFLGFFVPGSIIVLIAGGMAAQGFYSYRTLLYVIIAAALIGNTIGYLLGRNGKKIFKKYPTLWRHLEKGLSFFNKHGGKSIFIGHFLGPLRHTIPMVAGLAGMPFFAFECVNVISVLAWSVVHLSIGYAFGGLWDIAMLWLSRIGIALLLVGAVVALFVWAWEWMLKKGKDAFAIMRSFFQSAGEIVMRQPNVKAFAQRYERPLAFVGARFSTDSFFGLPLTILAGIFVYILGLLTDVIREVTFSSAFSGLDERIAHLLFDLRHPLVAKAFYFVTLFAQTGVIIAVMFFLTLLLWKKKHAVFAFGLWLTLFLSELLTQGGKILFQRIRPEELFRALSEDSFSFPSMHAATAAAFTGYIAYIVLRTSRSWSMKVGAVFTSLLAVLLIDASRLYLGVHYLSDVIAGDLVGLLCVVFVISVTEWLFSREEKAIPPLPLSVFWSTALFQCVIVIFLFFAVPSPLLQQVPPAPERITVAEMQELFKKGTIPREVETFGGYERQPLNVLLLGSRACLLKNMEKSGWKRADDISLGSTFRLLKSIVLQQPYMESPLSPVFYNSAPQTFGYSRTEGEEDTRTHTHLRLWETDYDTYYGRLFAATVSYDTHARWGMSHSIDTDVDSRRELLLTDLLDSGSVSAYQRFPFTPPIPDKGEAGTMYETDGKAVFMILSSCRP